MNHLRLIISFLILMPSILSRAQDNTGCNLRLFGKITDSENNLPVAYVSVYPSGGIPFTSADSLGFYQLNKLCPGKTIITVSRPGFIQDQYEIYLSADTSIDFKIKFDPSFFKTVEIISTRNQLLKDGIATTITPKELDKLRGNLLADITKNIPGVHSLNVGNNVSKPVIHGLHSNRILILNNGVRLEGQQWGSDHGPEIDPFIAHKITVVKGAGTLRYGADAIGGVIITEPKSMPQETGIGGTINIAGNSNGRLGIISGMLEGKSKWLPALSLRIQGTLKKGGNIHTPDYFIKNTGSRENNFSLTAAYNKGRFNSTIYHSKFYSEMGIFSGSHIGNITDLRNAIRSGKPFEESGFTYNIDRPYQQVLHDLTKADVSYEINKNNKISFQLSRQYNERSEFDKHRPLNDSLSALNRPELLMKLTTHMAEIHFSTRHNKNWESQFAFSGIDQANTYRGRYFIPNFRQQGLGSFVSTRYKVRNTTVEGSLRYDIRALQVFKYDADQIVSPEHIYKNISASITATQQITDKLEITINTASAWRPPTANELYSDGLHHGSASTEIGDSELRSERLYSTQGVIAYRNQILNLEVSPYFNYIDNFIFLDPQSSPTVTIRGSFPTFRFNQADVLLKGLDNTAGLQLGEHMRIIGSMSLLRALNKQTNDHQVMMPADSYRLKFEYYFREYKRFQNTSVSAQYHYVNKQWRVPANVDLLGPPDGYGLFGIQITSDIRLFDQNMTMMIGVNNLLNTSYRDYLNRFRYFTDETGRNITLRIVIPITSTKTSNEKN